MRYFYKNMSFVEVLKNAGMMLLWWLGGAVVILMGFYFLWLGFPKPDASWIFIFLGLILIGIGGLAILYGKNKHHVKL